MIIYFADRQQIVTGQASTGLPHGLIIIDDIKTEDIETGVASFDVTISYKESDRLDLEQMTEAGNYVFRSSGNDAECYTIIDAETDTKAKERHLYCEDAGLDLLNEICGDFEADSAHNIAWYINQFASGSGFEIGTNEIPSKTRTLAWTGEQTGTERIRSVATQFDNAEISYSFTIENMQITHRYINIWEKRGVDIGQQLFLNRDIDNIVVKRSVANLITSVMATGSVLEGEDEPLDLIGYTYDDGDIYLDSSTGVLYSRSGMGKWSRPNGNYIMGNFNYETESQSELCNRAVSYLKRYSDVEVNYEVDIVRGLENSHIGDRVNIIDDAGEVYLSARLLKLDTSITRSEKLATLGEYLIKTSGISDRIADLATQFAQVAGQNQALANSINILSETMDTMLTLEVDSVINNDKALLTAHLFNGNKEVTRDHSPSLYKWIRRTENGEHMLGRGYTLEVDLEEIGYAGTVLCRFIRPELFDLTDHMLVNITDENGENIQVAYAGVYSQPLRRRGAKLKALNRAVEETKGLPTLNREVNLYEHEGLEKRIEPIVQHFWTDEEGAHITEIGQDEFKDHPANGGGNLLARSDGIAIRDGETVLASFKGDTISLGEQAPNAQIAFCGDEARIRKDTATYNDREIPVVYLNTYPSDGESILEVEARRGRLAGNGFTGVHFTSVQDDLTSNMQSHHSNNIRAYVYTNANPTAALVTLVAATTGTTTPSRLLIMQDASTSSKSAQFQNITQLTSPVALTVVSDRRIKEHIKDLDEEASEFIRNLKPVCYRKDGQIHLGFYAQDVQEVNTMKADITPQIDDYIGLSYTDLIAPLVRYCQELEKRIEELEGK